MELVLLTQAIGLGARALLKSTARSILKQVSSLTSTKGPRNFKWRIWISVFWIGLLQLKTMSGISLRLISISQSFQRARGRRGPMGHFSIPSKMHTQAFTHLLTRLWAWVQAPLMGRIQPTSSWFWMSSTMSISSPSSRSRNRIRKACTTAKETCSRLPAK